MYTDLDQYHGRCGMLCQLPGALLWMRRLVGAASQVMKNWMLSPTME